VLGSPTRNEIEIRVTNITESITEKAGGGADGVLFKRVVIDVVGLKRSNPVSHTSQISGGGLNPRSRLHGIAA